MLGKQNEEWMEGGARIRTPEKRCFLCGTGGEGGGRGGGSLSLAVGHTTHAVFKGYAELFLRKRAI